MQNVITTGPHSPRRPSKLRISSEPSISTLFSPSPSIRKTHFLTPNISLPAAPQTPPSWTWTCHQCHSSFPLGATRRCLHDGHRFCAGATLDRRSGRVRRHKACGSTFDYVGWKQYNSWRDEAEKITCIVGIPEPKYLRRKFLGPRNNSAPEPIRESWDEYKENTSPVSLKNCERQCSFPSECRWNPVPRKEKKKVAKSSEMDKLEGTDSKKPVTVGPKVVETSAASPSPEIQYTADFRAPVLKFTAFKARLDRANSRRRSGSDKSRPALPELQLGVSVLMDVDAISPTVSLPENKGIEVAITANEEALLSPKQRILDIDMPGSWESDSDSESGTSPVDAMLGTNGVAGIRRKGSDEAVDSASGQPINWNWSLDGLGSKLVLGTDLASLIDVSESAWLAMTREDEDSIAPLEQ